MEKIKRLTVELADRAYTIAIGESLIEQPQHFNSLVNKEVVIISSVNVSVLYAERFKTTLGQLGITPLLFVLADGEENKTLDSFNQIISFLIANGCHRDVMLIALGGGMIGDLVGFAAACYLRGVAFIQIPTSLLAQVDASIGGKTGINHQQGKNLIGAFHQPQSVYVDIGCLQTLAQREFAAGMAEVIKYAVIADAQFYQWIDTNLDDINSLDPRLLQYMVARCCQIKADIVAQDEKEQNIRALLNLGHTFGHALEAETEYNVWLHGEAVAIGMMIAAEVSFRLGYLKYEDVEHLRQLLERAQLPVSLEASITYEQLRPHLKRDKKNLAGKFRFILPLAMGQAKVVENIAETIFQDALKACQYKGL